MRHRRQKSANGAMAGPKMITVYGHKEILNNSSSLKQLVRFLNNFREILLWVTLFKNFLQNFDSLVNMALKGEEDDGGGGGGYLHNRDIKKILKNSFLKSVVRF